MSWEKSMKLAFKNYLFLFFFSSLSMFCFTGCLKDQYYTELKQCEIVAQAHTLELQQIYLLETLLSKFDSLILPYGIKKQLVDQKSAYQKYKIKIEKNRLFGDYIDRQGTFYYEIFYLNGEQDSLYCYFNSADSFCVISNHEKLIVEGNISIKQLDINLRSIKTNFVVHTPFWGKIDMKSTGICNRVLKNPTKHQFEDGFNYSAKSTITNIATGKIWNSQVLELLKSVDAPNFPIAGKIITQSMDKENVEIDFNAFNDFRFDKIAKAKQNNTEWIFDIQ